MQGIKRRENKWINERNMLGWDEPGLGNKDRFSLGWDEFKGLGAFRWRFQWPFRFMRLECRSQMTVEIQIRGSSARRRLLKWMSWKNMRLFKESVWRTGTHTFVHTQTQGDKGSDVITFSHNNAFYISFQVEGEQDRLMLQKPRKKSISRRRVQNRVISYQKESSRKETKNPEGLSIRQRWLIFASDILLKFGDRVAHIVWGEDEVRAFLTSVLTGWAILTCNPTDHKQWGEQRVMCRGKGLEWGRHSK